MEGADQVRAVVHSNVRLRFQGGKDVIIIGFVVLTPYGENGNLIIRNKGSGHVVLGGQGIGGTDDHFRPPRLQGLEEACRLGGHVETCREFYPLKRLFLFKTFLDGLQDRHTHPGPFYS